MSETDAATTAFADQRELLFGVAYRILGRVADAEDVVQDTWLRWRDVDHDEVTNPTGYLVRIASRLALDRAQSAHAQREAYVGPWLPEPILTGPDVADRVAEADSVSLGMLVVLETLSPLERVVFVLREAFGYSHAEIGEVLGRSEATVRQLAHRARSHVQARRPRFDANRTTQRQVTERFLAACLTGDLDALVELLAPDVELTGDGGGVSRAPLRTILGADKVGRFLLGMAGRAPEHPVVYLTDVNGQLALVVTSDGQPHSVIAVDVVDDRITEVRVLANPEKLSGMSSVAEHAQPLPTPEL